MTEQLRLQWNDFKENITNAFATLRDDNDSSDVTLVCEDGKQIDAHRVVLCISSPFFQNVFQKAKHARLLLYMRCMKSENLLAIIDFLYHGEANVYQEHLDSFLAIAEELRLKGLTGKAKNEERAQKERKIPFPKNEPKVSQPLELQANVGQEDVNDYDTGLGTVALTSNYSSDLQELNIQMMSMMEKTSGFSLRRKPLHRCTPCGKEAEKNDLRKHIESKHLEGISIPCTECEKTFRSRGSLSMHRSREHK